VPKTPRQMPKAGFYVLKPTAYQSLYERGYKEAIYTTGVRGKGGHKCCRSQLGNFTQLFIPNSHAIWYTLLWSCVPGIKELAEKYDYYETFEQIPPELGFYPLEQ